MDCFNLATMSKSPAGKEKNSECCENVSEEENKQYKTTSTVEFACTPEREKGKGEKTNKKEGKQENVKIIVNRILQRSKGLGCEASFAQRLGKKHFTKRLRSLDGSGRY